ncbi:Protein phosphatase 1 regulatory subunit 12A [Seminavis robusta]|uniref:Protein phosphatase 1 regulatory subunit 12A n=1 Tax=Seminavis robusta TaxID=568900 RepID=A0A9N8DDV2_9STRA|nr:Protein phosphatase 1 regulatory subunit 12A [Seminavis robusta]|eukprot:Sro102_g051880.1 Protein phosphatase 1 regulatory subunit 12A (478) ;mRNA; f:5367-7744
MALLQFPCLVGTALLLLQLASAQDVEYGVDVSFPIHHRKVSDNFAWLPHNQDPAHHKTPKQFEEMVVSPLPGREEMYLDFIKSCEKAFGGRASRCRMTEQDRIDMSLRQPQSMQNYTEVGFKKIKAPEKVFKMVKEFWEANKDKEKKETWGTANTYTNNWVVPTHMVSVEDSGLRGGGFGLKKQIWDAARDTLQEWTGQELTECSLYGIRVYKEGSILSTHVDRLPLVSSAIINVASDLDEPWPLEVYGHDGRATNVTMEPGDMVLYESHSVLHGRPFPLKGRFVANLFIHFEPTGHTLRHEEKVEAEQKARMAKEKKKGSWISQYKLASKMGFGGHENENNGLPPYIIPGTPEEANWRRSHPSGNQRQQQDRFTTGSTPVHFAAQKGDLKSIMTHIDKAKESVHLKDANGWTPLHEAARGGHKEVVKYLVEKGADKNALTGVGESALWWARHEYGDEHPVVEFLEELGALEVGPDL